MKLFKIEKNDKQFKMEICGIKIKFSRKKSVQKCECVKWANRCHLGFMSYMGENVWIVNEETIIGKFCSLANNISIGLPNHPLKFLSSHPFAMDALSAEGVDSFLYDEYKKKSNTRCEVGNDVWIGNSVSVGGGW